MEKEKTEDTTQTPQLQTDYPPPLADYPNLPEGFPSYTEAPETDKSSARNFSLSIDEMAEMLQTNIKALYHVFSEAVIPLVAMLPDEMKVVLNQPTFFGIAWTTLVWFQIGLTSSLFLLFCGCACCARRSRAHQKELLMEIEMITEQKAKALDALKTTTKHFSDQNLEYFNYQQLTKDVEKEKEELKTLYEELKEEKERQDEKYAELENMNIQLQEELESFKQKVQHHGNASDKAKNQMQKMQRKINELEAKLQSHHDDALSLRQDIDSLTKENENLAEVKVQLTSDVKEHAEKLEALTENVAELETENKTLKETVSDKDSEIEVLKDCLVQLKGLEDYGEGTEVDNEARIQQLLDVNRANAKITLLEDERKTMEEKMEEEARKIHNLEGDNRTLRKEMETIQQECKKAKEDHEEARTKLDVLTEYFKGKEVEMQRKLGKEEALKFHSQKELDSLGEKTAAAEAELANYKQQIQDLKDEIEKSERSFRQQIAAHEKKAHESWMASRTAERKLKETNKEIASLRQRLTELQGRKTTDASPLIKPSPERMGSPSNASESSMLRRDQPSRNSILEDAPSPPMIGGQRHSPSEKDRPPSRPVRVSRSGRPPSFHEDFFPPEEMMPPPDAMPFRGPPGGFHPGMDPYGPPPPLDGYMPPEMDFDGPPRPPPPDMGYGPPGPYDFGPRGPPPPSMGGDPRFPPPFMGPHPDDFPPDGPYGAMDPGMGPPPPFRGPPPDWNDRVPHPGMRGPPPPPAGDPRTSRPVSRGGPPPSSHIQPDQAPRSSTPVEFGEQPQNQGAQNQNRRTSNVQP